MFKEMERSGSRIAHDLDICGEAYYVDDNSHLLYYLRVRSSAVVGDWSYTVMRRIQLYNLCAAKGRRDDDYRRRIARVIFGDSL